MRNSVCIGLLLAGGLLGAGCSHNVDPVFDVEGHRMVVLPMKDPLSYHFESRLGIEVSQLITEELQEKRKSLGKDDVIEVVPTEDLVHIVQGRRQDPKDIPFADLGRAVKADLVLIGSIEKFETRIPGDIGLSRGRATVSIRVIEVAKPDRPFYKRTINALFPPEDAIHTGVLPSGSEADVIVGLKAVIVDDIAKLFYVHEQEKNVRGEAAR